jgi:reactive chlorine resistance protein C
MKELEMAAMETRNDRLGEEALRWSLVVIFFLFGVAKFAAYEAEGVAGIAQNYWLFGWLYPLGGVQFASNVIGTLELSTGLLLALGSRFTLASFAGAVMGVCTFLVTLSFMISAPTAFEAGYGFPFLGSSGQFLMKDLVLLAACFSLALTAGRRLVARQAAR